jgi:hypothetical protein
MTLDNATLNQKVWIPKRNCTGHIKKFYPINAHLNIAGIQVEIEDGSIIEIPLMDVSPIDKETTPLTGNN